MKLVLAALGDHEPKSQRQIVKITGLSEVSAHNCLYMCWKRGLILRTKEHAC